MKKITNVIGVIFLILYYNSSSAQLEIVKSKTLGGGRGSAFEDIIAYPGKGYLLLGENFGKGDPITCGSVEDTMRFWLVKLDSAMNVEWQRCYGKDYGYLRGRLKFIEPDGRGGYVLFGEIKLERKSYLPCYHGTRDLYLLHIDSLGNVLEERCYGGGGFESALDFHRTRDGGYVVGSTTRSIDGDLDSNGYVTQFTTDAWIFKLDSLFDIEWSLQWGGYGDDDAHVVVEAETGGYYAAMASSSYDGDVNSNYGFEDFWLLRLDDTGGIRWQRHYGGDWSDQIRSIIPDGKGHLYIGGYSKSSFCTSGSDSYWVLKTDTLGDIRWEKCYGSDHTEELSGGMLLKDDKLFLSGRALFGGGGDPGYGSYDVWVLVLDEEGRKVASKNFGGSKSESCFGMRIINSEFFITGATTSVDNDIIDYHINSFNPAAWVFSFRLRPVGIGAPPQRADYYLGDNIPNPFEGSTRIPYRVPEDAKAVLIISSSEGKELMRKKLNGGEGEIVINTSTWPAGIYIYSLQLNGAIAASRKMSVGK